MIVAVPFAMIQAQQLSSAETVARMAAPLPPWSFLGEDRRYSRFADVPAANVLAWREALDPLLAIGFPATADLATDPRFALGIRQTNARGEFHRPLEADEVGQTSLIGSGSGRTSGQASAGGRFAISRSRREGSTHSLALDPYDVVPYVTADTTTPALQRSGALFEGALAAKARGWEYVAGGGYTAAEERSRRAPVARTVREYAVGGGLGLAHDVPGLGGRGAIGIRWREGSETSTDTPNPGALRIFELSGLREIEPRDITSAPSFYQRRHGATSTMEASLIRPVSVLRPSLWIRRENQRDRRTTRAADAPPGDTWREGLSEYGAGVALPLRAFGTFSITGEHWQSNGDGTVQGLSAVVHRSRRRGDRVKTALLVRDTALWFGAVGIAGERYRDRSSDAAAELSTEREGWRWQLSTAAGLKMGTVAAASLSYDLVLRGEAANIPAGETVGPAFRQWIAPELEYYAAPTRAHTLAAVIVLPLGKRRTWLTVRRWKSFPTAVPGPFTPPDDRIITSVSLGFFFGE